MSTDFVSATGAALPIPEASAEIQQPSPPPAPSTYEAERAYDAAWAAFQAAFDAAIAGQARQFQTLLELARSLPTIADQEIARTRAEGERRLVAEREARLAILSDVAAHCEALRHAMASLAAELASAARRVDALGRQVHVLLAADAPATWSVGTRETIVAESSHDHAGPPPSTDEGGTDPWALVEAAMRLFKIRSPADERGGSGADPGAWPP